MKNKGLDLRREQQELTHDEWVFGALSPDCIYAVPLDERETYLPIGEKQYGREDFMDCVTRGYLNILEAKFTYAYRNNLIKPENRAWLENKGYVVYYKGLMFPYIEFSDRFIAVKSGTTKDGNSMKAPADAIYRHGLIPKSMLKANSRMRFADYHDKNDITKEMEKLALELIKRFAINYEQVLSSDLEILLDRDEVNLAGNAWPNSVDGEYPRTEATFNHAFKAFKKPKTFIFDNYLDDGKEGDWIKKLASDYKFYDYGYRIFIRSEQTEEERRKSLSLLERILIAFREFLEGVSPPNAYDQDPKTLPMNQENEEKENLPISLREELHKEAMSWLGKDASPLDKAPDELGCAESVANIIGQITPFPLITGTWTLMSNLHFSKKFEKIDIKDLKPGDILLYATGEVKAPFVGHVFICGEDGKLMSNNSVTGLWDKHYTLAKARKRWEDVGYKPHCYRLNNK